MFSPKKIVYNTRALEEKMDLHKFAPNNMSQICKNRGVNINGKCLIWIPKNRDVNNLANVAFTIFAPDLLLRFYKFGIYLQGANLCKTIFRPMEDSVTKFILGNTSVIDKQQRTETRCYLCNWNFHLQSIQAYRYNYEIPRYYHRQH